MRTLSAILAALFLTACFWGPEAEERYPLTDDLCLYWWGGEEDSKLVSFGETGDSYDEIVPSVVFAAGANADFVILKRHPNRKEEVDRRLFCTYDSLGWRLADPADSIYLRRLSSRDSIFCLDGVWRHTVGGWTPPDSIRNPYRRVTRYYILDLRAFRADACGLRRHSVAWSEALRRHVHTYTTEEAYLNARESLGVPDSLGYSVRIDCME